MTAGSSTVYTMRGLVVRSGLFIRSAVALLACGTVAAVAAAPAAAVEQTAASGGVSSRVIATGLDNPRGIALGRGGSLFVAEAGRPGGRNCVVGPDGDTKCLSSTGSVTMVAGGGQRRVVTGLPSVAAPENGYVYGPQDVAVDGRGRLVVAVGFHGRADTRDQLGPAAARLGTLQRIDPARPGSSATVADLAAYEFTHNPDGGTGQDSNPYSVVLDPTGALVADSGGNTTYRAGADGHLDVLAAFPAREVTLPGSGETVSIESVPTAVVRGPDGAFYVGEFSGEPYPLGGSPVYRVVPGHAPTVYATGFTNIIDIAFDREGRLYVLELTHNGLLSGDPTGALIRIDRSGHHETLPVPELVFPTSVAVDGNGTIYITNNALTAGKGEVLQIQVP